MHSANGLRRLALLCLVVSKVTVTMDVYRGTVVHCLTPQKMEILEDHLVGVDTAHGGQVSACKNNRIYCRAIGFRPPLPNLAQRQR